MTAVAESDIPSQQDLESQYNSRVEVLRSSNKARILRIYPDKPVVRYLGGQYGSLGYLSRRQEVKAKLIKRPYSLSSSIIDINSGSLLDHRDLPYYEFYFNQLSQIDSEEALTPLLFELQTGDRIFCGQKIVGHYTLKDVPENKNLLLIGSTTGESPNNAIINQALIERRSGKIAHLSLGDLGWESLYSDEHMFLMKKFNQYKYLSLNIESYSPIEKMIEMAAKDVDFSVQTFGFKLNPEDVHVFICGDPLLVGAPKKLGAWQYEFPDYGVIRYLREIGFEIKSKFKEGNLEYETYW